jgi:hypothetical protein
MVFWNQRMNLLTGESKYVDVLERSLYNGALDGLSLSGDRFFYGNPLASSGQYARSEWFGTACCPSNISRLVESLGDYVYAKSDNAIWVNLFVGSNTTIPLKSGKVQLAQQTGYPWEGMVQITVSPERKTKFALLVRIPGWAQNQPAPGNTYRYADTNTEAYTLSVNGKPAAAPLKDGYAVIERDWKKGDVVALKPAHARAQNRRDGQRESESEPGCPAKRSPGVLRRTRRQRRQGPEPDRARRGSVHVGLPGRFAGRRDYPPRTSSRTDHFARRRFGVYDYQKNHGHSLLRLGQPRQRPDAALVAPQGKRRKSVGRVTPRMLSAGF